MFWKIHGVKNKFEFTRKYIGCAKERGKKVEISTPDASAAVWSKWDKLEFI